MDITFLARSVFSPTQGQFPSGSFRSIDIIGRKIVNCGHNVRILTTESSNNAIGSDVPYSVIEISERERGIPATFDRQIPKILSQYRSDTDIFHLFYPQHIPGIAHNRPEHNDTPIVGRLNSYGIFCFNHSEMDGECHKSCNLHHRMKHYDGSFPKSIALTPVMVYADRRLDDMNSVDHLFAQSPAVKRIYKESGVTEPEITVVPNFFDRSITHQNSTNPPEKFDLSKRNILFVGRLVPEKGVETLLQSASRLPNDIQVHIVGDGPKRQSLSALANEIGNNSVTFHGYVDYAALPDYYINADLFVHPGIWPDPCPRSILEAMTFELPCIVSNIGGPPWMCGDGGLTFTPGDVDDLTRVITRAATDNQLRKRLQSSLRKEIERFEPQTVIDSYLTIYQNLINS